MTTCLLILKPTNATMYHLLFEQTIGNILNQLDSINLSKGFIKYSKTNGITLMKTHIGLYTSSFNYKKEVKTNQEFYG